VETLLAKFALEKNAILTAGGEAALSSQIHLHTAWLISLQKKQQIYKIIIFIQFLHTNQSKQLLIFREAFKILT
jgi:hypothetical protein